MKGSPSSSGAAQTAVARPHRILLSYHYFRRPLKPLLARFKYPVKVFGDSGAFSAWSLGKPIEVGEYADWLAMNSDELEVYSNLDVIGDPKGTEKNQAELERRGFHPIPVFHAGSEWRELDRLIDAGYPYIALGGLVDPNKRGGVMPYLVECFIRARNAGKGTVFHGFGMTQTDAITGLPWFSVDSSSWSGASRFARLQLFDPINAKFQTCELFDPVALGRYRRLITRYGSTIDELVDRKHYHHSTVTRISVRSWRALEEWCRKRHGPIYLPTDRRADPGLRLYLAGTGGDLSQARIDAQDAAQKEDADASGLRLYFAQGRENNNTISGQRDALADEAGLRLYLAQGQGDPNDQRNLDAQIAGHDAAGLRLYLANTAFVNHKYANDELTGDDK